MFPLTGTIYDPQRKVWCGPVKKDLYHEEMTLGEAMFLEYIKHPKKIVQINDTTDEKMTAAEFLDFVRALSNNFLKLGLKPGNVVGLYSQNCTHTATVMVSSFLCGTPVNALYPSFDKENVQLIFKTTTPSIIFCDVENYAIASKVCQDLCFKIPIFIMNGEVEGVPSILTLVKPEARYENEPFALKTGSRYRFPCINLKGDDTAVILCSSGTTGTPKGVLCSHRALLNQHVYLNLRADSVLCTFSTMYWASGLFTLTGGLLNCCLRIVVNRPYSPEYFLHLVERHKITHMMGNGAQMAELFMYDNVAKIQKCLASLDSLVIGGSKVPIVVQEKITAILKEANPKRPGFGLAYGMSELSGMVSYNGGYLYDCKEGSEGKLAPNKKVRIVSENGAFLGPNEHGQIIVSSPYTWLGYYRNEAASKSAYIDKWLYTGDIGFFDSDGFLHVCARNNDIFKARNFQIYPQMIEDVVAEVPGVFEACVFGIPDFVATNLIACAVVRKDDDEGKNLTDKLIISHVQQKMSAVYHLSGGVYFLETIPKTGLGKVQRNKVLLLCKKP